MDKENIAWTAPEYDYEHREPAWYLVSILVAAVLLILALWQKNFLFAAFVLLAEMAIILGAKQLPPVWDFEISGGGVKIGRITIPPPSMGVLSLLDMIESPFVTGDASKISINEVLKSLYVMSRGRDAVQPLMESIALGKSIEKSKEIAEKSPQFFDVYLKYHAINAAKRSAFDAAVDAFADEIGLFDPEAAISLIGDYLTACMAGFDMLEKKPESDLVKKKSGFWTLTGSLLSRLISMMLFRAIMKK